MHIKMVKWLVKALDFVITVITVLLQYSGFQNNKIISAPDKKG